MNFLIFHQMLQHNVTFTNAGMYSDISVCLYMEVYHANVWYLMSEADFQ